ncbi:MAG: amidohydrolase family protein, partial [Deltaproteobacteria bacterium]|nr:amidohydrolase family protein [Deltaproteobacteria bacterium]
HGSLPLGKLVDAGIPVGLGTDIWHTRLGFSLWEEMRLALELGSDPLPKPTELLRMATLGGARALGLDHLTGTLETGKQADYIVVHTPETSDDDDFLIKLITETHPQHVKRVVVAGNALKNS